jgi:hypothetical protein
MANRIEVPPRLNRPRSLSMRDVFRIITLVMIASLLMGCGRPATDVTSSPEYNFVPFAGSVWRTKVKTALADIKPGSISTRLHLIAPEHFDPAHPKYRPIAQSQIIAELPPGTRLRIDRLMKNNRNWGGVWVTAVLEDGIHSGKTVHLSNYLLAKNRFVWAGWSDSKEWGADPDMLEKAE